MTDHEGEDIVADWINNMSPLYKLYNACIHYGKNNGSSVKSLEARDYTGAIESCEKNS